MGLWLSGKIIFFTGYVYFGPYVQECTWKRIYNAFAYIGHRPYLYISNIISDSASRFPVSFLVIYQFFRIKYQLLRSGKMFSFNNLRISSFQITFITYRRYYSRDSFQLSGVKINVRYGLYTPELVTIRFFRVPNQFSRSTIIFNSLVILTNFDVSTQLEF